MKFQEMRKKFNSTPFVFSSFKVSIRYSSRVVLFKIKLLILAFQVIKNTFFCFCSYSLAPPQRNRFRPHDTKNARDLSDWTYKEKFIALRGSKGVPGRLFLFEFEVFEY